MFDVFYIGPKPGLFPHEHAVSSLDEARRLCRTRYCWIVNYLSDYQDFDFLWEPSPWQADQTHVWPSQHQDNGGTMLLPKQYPEEINRDHDVVPRSLSAPRLHIKHDPKSIDAGDLGTRYISDMLGTMRRALSKVDWEYCWVTSDVCDYTGFDFTWHPSEWQQQMLHVFASDDQKFGDTFYVHVPTFLEKSRDLKLLEWFETLNFVTDIIVPRVPLPHIQYTEDTIVDAVWKHQFETPLVQFYRHSPCVTPPTVSLWQESTKTVMPLSTGNSVAIVPRECKSHLKTQIYDYAFIDKKHRTLKDPSLDIVFISNGEPNADQNWATLLYHKQGQPNRCVRIDGVNGRAAAYHAAAEASETPWFFAVFAKLEVLGNFDWSWQPDYFQQPKHYIFHAMNPCNQLEYGHQAMIAYNKKLVLANPGRGLDFTLDDAHEVVPILSGVARYNVDAWTAWRTAFREALKLKASLPDIENQYRLDQWLTRGSGPYGEYSVYGAEDALAYYTEVDGKFEDLKKSYEWTWLASYAFLRRNLKFDR